MDTPTCPVTFNMADLWLLHAFVRHEAPKQDEWKFPPVSYSLNEQIAEGIRVCHLHRLPETTLLLTLHDCLVVDYHIRADFKTPEGGNGLTILLKTFAARAALNGDLPDAGVTDSGYGEAMRSRHNQEE